MGRVVDAVMTLVWWLLIITGVAWTIFRYAGIAWKFHRYFEMANW